MFTNKMNKAVATLAVLTGTLAAALPAHAASYSLTLDPEFGSPFTHLGWNADIRFDASSACISNTSSCGSISGNGISFTSLDINFYDFRDSNKTTLYQESFPSISTTAVSIGQVIVSSGEVIGMNAGPFPSFVPTTTGLWTLTDALNQPVFYRFALDIEVGNTASGGRISEGFLYYIKDGLSLTPRACGALVPQQPESCGWSKIAAKGEITRVPEPGTYALIIAALTALGLTTRRRTV